MRDYVHVWDLARAHVAALQRFDEVVGESRYQVINLGTGTGTTVRELVDAFNAVVRVRFDGRRTAPAGRRRGRLREPRQG